MSTTMPSQSSAARVQTPSADSRLPDLKEMKDLSEMSAGGYTEIEGMQCCTLSAKLRE